MTSSPLPSALAALALALALTSCAADEPAPSGATPASDPTTSSGPSQSASAQGDPSSTASATTAAAGSWIDYAAWDADRTAYADTEVVLFFHADWCPSCRDTAASLDTDGVPDGLTVVKVDFDTATDLRQKYAVTVQHTFVHIDPDGTALDRWSGSATGADIAAKV